MPPPSGMHRVASLVATLLAASQPYREAVDTLRSMSLHNGYVRPVTSVLQTISERQGAPALPGAAEMLVKVIDSKEDHIAEALQLVHPLAHNGWNAAADLMAAVQHVTQLETADRVKSYRDGVRETLDGICAHLSRLSTGSCARYKSRRLQRFSSLVPAWPCVLP
jgi:hypothetical protein